MAPAPQQGGGSDNSMGILWIIAAILIFTALVWYLFKAKIIHFYFKIKLLEIDFISLFTHRLEDVRTAILNADTSQLNLDDVVRVGNAVGEYIRIPIIAIIVVLAFVVYFANTTRTFKRSYSMRELSKLEKDNWPQITPVIGLDLINADIDKGPWAMAMTPMQFCKRHNLLQEHKPQPREGMTRKEWNRIDVTLKRGQANKLFSLQLGTLWQGVERLPPHARALFAVFAARYNGDSKASAALLAHISASSGSKLDFSGTDALLQKYQDTKTVKKLVDSHAYVLTVMAALLEACREDGVQASADFLWLKPVDRRLWYMLNTVGRQTPFVEVAGPFAHWIAEKEIGRRLIVPMIEEATNALELTLKEIVYRPDDKS